MTNAQVVFPRRLEFKALHRHGEACAGQVTKAAAFAVTQKHIADRRVRQASRNIQRMIRQPERKIPERGQTAGDYLDYSFTKVPHTCMTCEEFLEKRIMYNMYMVARHEKYPMKTHHCP